MINPDKPGTFLGREKPIGRPERIGRIRRVTPDKARVEVQVGDTYAACPGCSTVYNITTRVCCPSCRCARQNAR